MRKVAVVVAAVDYSLIDWRKQSGIEFRQLPITLVHNKLLDAHLQLVGVALLLCQLHVKLKLLTFSSFAAAWLLSLFVALTTSGVLPLFIFGATRFLLHFIQHEGSGTNVKITSV